MKLPSSDFTVLSNDISTSKIGPLADEILPIWWLIWEHFGRCRCSSAFMCMFEGRRCNCLVKTFKGSRLKKVSRHLVKALRRYSLFGQHNSTKNVWNLPLCFWNCLDNAERGFLTV